MRFILSTLFLALSIGSATAASFDDLPPCSKQCIKDAIKSSTNCAETDVKCACANKDKIQQAGAQCVVAACGMDVALSKSLQRN